MTAFRAQLDMFAGPAQRRRDDTSRGAAEALEAALPALRLSVLRAIEAAGPEGLTADEAAALLDIPVLTARPRVSELRKDHWILDSGKRRRSSCGKPSIVWVRLEG